MNQNYINALTIIPTGDLNFQYALKKYANEAEIMEALEIMKKSPTGNKSRIAACERELRKRMANIRKEQLEGGQQYES